MKYIVSFLSSLLAIFSFKAGGDSVKAKQLKGMAKNVRKINRAKHDTATRNRVQSKYTR
jgi:hypothetical protein